MIVPNRESYRQVEWRNWLARGANNGLPEVTPRLWVRDPS